MDAALLGSYYALMALGAIVSVVVGLVAVRNREATGATALAVMAGAMAIWIVADLSNALASSREWSIYWAKANWIGSALVPTTMVVFVLSYTGRERLVRPATITALYAVPLAIYALVLTNGAHGLIWRSIEPVPETAAGFVFVHGPAFYAYLVYGYLLLAVGTVLLVGFLVRSPDLYRGQAALVLVAGIAPWLANVLYVSELTVFDPTSLGFAVTAGALGLAMVRYRLTDVVPVARDTVVDNITDGVIVLDDGDRIVDVNPRGRQLVDHSGTASLMGQPASAVFPARIVDRYDGVVQGSDELAVETDYGTRHLAVDVTPLSDRRDRTIGRLFLVRDVTDRRRYERELERQNERLDRFASLVSHDLRNPLNIAQGYADILDQRTDDSAVEEILAAHDRMERIVEDVLTVARQGKPISEREPAALAALVRDAWDGVATAEATLVCEVDPTHEVQTAPSRLVQAFENLFRNAIDHAGEDVTVTVDLLGADGAGSDPPNRARGFAVEDDGPGIPADERESVLEAGYSTSADGTGLGLDIVRGIVEAHGWTLSVAEGTDGGARFEVRYDESPPPAENGALAGDRTGTTDRG